MNSMKGKSAMLMTKGIMDMRNDPPRLVCSILSFRDPATGKEVTLYPIPNMGAPSYFARVMDADTQLQSFDKILCEDGRLPFRAGSIEAKKQQTYRRFFPYFGFRPVVENGEKFDGLLARDAVESRMAYQMLVDGWEPPVDPRARRGIERIASYPDNTKVCVPWGVYHLPYFRYRLLKDGWVQTNAVDVTVMGFRDVFMAMLAVSLLGFGFVFVLVMLIFMF